jgi:hypothetical protein
LLLLKQVEFRVQTLFSLLEIKAFDFINFTTLICLLYKYRVSIYFILELNYLLLKLLNQIFVLQFRLISSTLCILEYLSLSRNILGEVGDILSVLLVQLGQFSDFTLQGSHLRLSFCFQLNNLLLQLQILGLAHFEVRLALVALSLQSAEVFFAFLKNLSQTVNLGLELKLFQSHLIIKFLDFQVFISHSTFEVVNNLVLFSSRIL